MKKHYLMKNIFSLGNGNQVLTYPLSDVRREGAVEELAFKALVPGLLALHQSLLLRQWFLDLHQWP